MAEPTPVEYVPWAINNATLQLDDFLFEDSINRIELVPSYQNETFDTINGVSHPIPSTATWAMRLDFGQDWSASTSLSNFLVEHDGEFVAFTATSDEDGVEVTGEVLIRAGAFGGQGKRHAAASVQLPLRGKPTFTPLGA